MRERQVKEEKLQCIIKRVEVFFYIHVRLFLKHFNFVAFIEIVTMMRNCI